MDGLRYENKYFISAAGLAMLRTRLEAAADRDPHAGGDGGYLIRSLYFDDYANSALCDKIEGIEKREKFRIRFYNHDAAAPVLESKQKLGKMTRKQSAVLTCKQARQLARGEIDFLGDTADPLLRRFYVQARTRLLRPAVVVDYRRYPFVFEDVRVTLDCDLHSGNHNLDFLNPAMPTIPVLPGDRSILEVKYDNALPDRFRRVLGAVRAQPSAISKYQLCRQFQA